jgi:triacylglycerol lipase
MINTRKPFVETEDRTMHLESPLSSLAAGLIAFLLAFECLAQSAPPVQRNLPSSTVTEGAREALPGRQLPQPVWWTPEELQRPGAGAFTRFRYDATGRNAINAYLLTYLSTAIYVDYGLQPILNLPFSRVEALKNDRTNRGFVQEFSRVLRPLFIDREHPGEPPQIDFFSFSDRRGYDPEAAVIGTPRAVFVVVRGTDRVAGAPLMAGTPENAEWMKTNFQIAMTRPGNLGSNVGVHAGFWNSLTAIAEDVAKRVVELRGDRQLPVWITGHSLGGAQAQLLAVYLHSVHGVRAQGVYVIGSPHPGDEQFAAAVNAIGGANRPVVLQRFEFVDDPATVFPPSSTLQTLIAVRPGYQPAGMRVWYEDLLTVRPDVGERSAVEMLDLLRTVWSLPTSFIQDAFRNNTPLPISGLPSNFCYHYPAWYLRAAHEALPQTVRAAMPRPTPEPTTRNFSCDPLTIARARVNPARDLGQGTQEIVNVLASDVEQAAYSAQQLFANVTGNVIENGTYTIRPLLNPERGLARPVDATNGSRVSLADSNPRLPAQRWVIESRVGGYLIRSGGRFLDVPMDSLLRDGSNVVMWDANLPSNPLNRQTNHNQNQLWQFYRVGPSRYLIRNNGSGKVLDAQDATRSTRVRQWGAHDNNRSQVWIIERAR